MRNTDKKILIVTCEFPPIVGGAGVYAHDLAIGLSKNSCAVDVVTYYINKKSCKIYTHLKDCYGVNVFYFRQLRLFHFLQFFLLIIKCCKSENYDLIIINDSRAKRIFALFRVFFKKSTIKKSISIFHGNEINSIFKNPSFLMRLFNIDKKTINLFKRQKSLITVSESEENIWNKFFQNIPVKIKMIKHGISEDIFFKRSTSDTLRVKSELNLPLDKLIFVSASRLVKMKGQDDIIYAFNRLSQRHKNIYLLIIGDGDNKQNLLDEIIRLNLEDSIRLVNAVDRYTLSKFFSASDIFVLISKYFESFGLVYIEAAACGIPSICGNLGGVKEAVIDNYTGYVVDSSDVNELERKMESLIINKELTKQLGKNALNNFRKYHSCSIMAEKIIECI